jgi:erythromycin esterase-like protein
MGHPTAGLLLEKRYHAAYYALGLIFGGGAARAIPAGETTPRTVPMPPPSPNTLEAVLDDAGADYFVDGHALDTATQTWFSQPHRLRRIDLWTDAQRPETTWTDERFGDALDGFIYLRTTDAGPLIERAKSFAAPVH